ncbi:MAG: nucleotide-binding protein [Nitrososphaerota archaeon]|nr:nucleotide-binding protein [Nitrososphaerota archaeon]
MAQQFLVLDTTAFYAGVPYTNTTENLVTTPDVISEVSNERTRSLIALSKINVLQSTPQDYKRVKEAARITGDSGLSKADLSVLALCLSINAEGNEAILLSDDFAVENVASRLGIKARPLMTSGIKTATQWVFFCPACGKKYEKQRLDCLVCGTKLERRLKKN